ASPTRTTPATCLTRWTFPNEPTEFVASGRFDSPTWARTPGMKPLSEASWTSSSTSWISSSQRRSPLPPPGSRPPPNRSAPLHRRSSSNTSPRSRPPSTS
ncbi:unnamed protein product, partial [Prorocentrum cordatum]